MCEIQDKFNWVIPVSEYWHKGVHQRYLFNTNKPCSFLRRVCFYISPTILGPLSLWSEYYKGSGDNLYQRFCDGMKWISFEVWSLKAQHEAQIKWRTFAITSNVLNNLVSVVSLCMRQMEHYWLMGCSK